jgi:hypothetical protein
MIRVLSAGLKFKLCTHFRHWKTSVSGILFFKIHFFGCVHVVALYPDVQNRDMI